MASPLPMSDAQYSVIIAKHGTRMATRSEVFLNFAHYGQRDAPMQMDYFIWVIRSEERTILVDTGYSPAGAANRRREILIGVPDLLGRLGVAPEEITQVIISHAHYDHIGNLDAFPNARFLIAEAELRFWNGRNASKPLFHHSIEDDEIAALNRLVEDGRVDLFSGTHHPAPGIEVLEVGGHTPGQAVVLVDTPDGAVLLASDAMHYYEELDADMPFTSVVDVAGMYDAFARLRDLLDGGRAVHLVSGHDPLTLERFRAVPGLEGIAAIVGGA